MKPMLPLKPLKAMAPMPPIAKWWPPGLGDPATTGRQDGVRYAFFPDKQLLLIEEDGKVKTFASGRHRIRGVSQANNASRSLVLTTQHGPVRVADLKQLS